MKVECCACGHEYTMQGNLYQASPVPHSQASRSSEPPLLLCPHCGLQHVVSFLPVPRRLALPSDPQPKRRPVDHLKLAVYYHTLGAARFANATRVDQSGSDDTSVTDWDRAHHFIVAMRLYTDKALSPLPNYALQWRNKTDEGSFANMGNTESDQIRYDATTNLTNNTTVTALEHLCDAQSGYTRADGREHEGLANCGSCTAPDDCYIELQWATRSTEAHYSDEYEFRLWQTSEGTSIGTLIPTITMAADPAGGKPVHFMHYARQRRS